MKQSRAPSAATVALAASVAADRLIEGLTAAAAAAALKINFSILSSFRESINGTCIIMTLIYVYRIQLWVRSAPA